MAKRIMDPNFYPCGHARNEENTRHKKNGTKVCKECERISAAAYQKANREKYRAAGRRAWAKARELEKPTWYEKNLDHARAKQKEWHENNRERSRQLQKEYRERQKAKRAELEAK